jgi:hypothetical protein
MENMTRLLGEKIQHKKVPAVRIAWWILWRRICGGLNSSIQTELFNTCGAHLLPGMKHLKKGPHADNQELTEIWRLGSSLERISHEYKIALGEQLISRVNKARDENLVMWALSRIGSRVPFGDTAQFIIPAITVEQWIQVLLSESLIGKPNTANALLSLARKSGVPALDISSSLSEKVIIALTKKGISYRKLMTLRESVLSDSTEQSKQFGESLPEGLSLGK